MLIQSAICGNTFILSPPTEISSALFPLPQVQLSGLGREG